MKTEYTIERGTHYSKGKKNQPSLLVLIPLLIGIILHFLGGVSVWYSVGCYAIAAVLYRIVYQRSMYTLVKVVFDRTCIYDMQGPDQHDINKLFGLGFGSHSMNSARFGWNSINGTICLYAFVHKNGHIESKKMMDCTPNEPVDLTLKVTDTEYEFTAANRNGERARTKFTRAKAWNSFFIYKLFPYFGGNQTAPQDMKFEMTYVE